MPEIRTILHPTDFSETSEAACQLATALARDYGARLVVLYVYPPPLNGAEAVDRERSNDIEEDLLAKLRDLIPDDRTIAIEYRAVMGHPAAVILQIALEERTDLIVMGTCGRSGLRRVVMGSVAEEVSRNARCPVATIRAFLPVPRDGIASKVGYAGLVEPRDEDPNLEFGAGD